MPNKLCEKGGLSKSLRYPSLSIIVPAYNMEKQVSKCITSLFKSAEQYLIFVKLGLRITEAATTPMRLHGQQSKSGGGNGQKLRAKSSDIALQ
jgi:hypothetical protein